jgi:hypothetical protein
MQEQPTNSSTATTHKKHRRFSFRQQEFARYYAAGFPAYRAALQAGYARSTAETNAARLLAHPAVQLYIRAQREALNAVAPQDLILAFSRLRFFIETATDHRLANASIRELRQLQSHAAKPTIAALAAVNQKINTLYMPASTDNAQQFLDNPTYQDTEPEETRTLKSDNVEMSPTQHLDSEHLTSITDLTQTSHCSPYTSLTIPEQNTLTDGRPAYDLHLKPTDPPQAPIPDLQPAIIQVSYLPQPNWDTLIQQQEENTNLSAEPTLPPHMLAHNQQ